MWLGVHLYGYCFAVALEIFRPEVYENRKFRLHGDVMITQSLPVSVMVGLLFATIVFAGGWVVTGRYARTELAPGRIVPDGALTRIVPSRAGVVTKLSVHEGDIVAAGQPLATVLVEQASADRADPTAANLGAVDNQRALVGQQIAMARRDQKYDRDRLVKNISQYYAQISSNQMQIEIQKNIVESARQSFEPLKEVVDKGFVSKFQYEAKRQAYLNQQQQLQQLESRLEELKGQLRGAQGDLEGLPDQTKGKVIEFQSSSAELTQKRIEIENGRSYVITAPVAGRVSALQVTQGATVSSNLPLMSIIDQHARMAAELFAPSRAIGFAHNGQEVRLLYDAFPYQRFGSFVGKITNISRTILAPNEVDAPLQTKEPVYRVRVALADQDIKAFGETVPLQPGMTLQANIVLDRRTFFDWLMEPINAVRNRS